MNIHTNTRNVKPNVRCRGGEAGEAGLGKDPPSGCLHLVLCVHNGRALEQVGTHLCRLPKEQKRMLEMYSLCTYDIGQTYIVLNRATCRRKWVWIIVTAGWRSFGSTARAAPAARAKSASNFIEARRSLTCCSVRTMSTGRSRPGLDTCIASKPQLCVCLGVVHAEPEP